MADTNSDGLHWFEYNSSGTLLQKLVNVTAGKIYKMDSLDGTWDEITGAVTVTADNHCDFENWMNRVFITNGANVPFYWDGGTEAVVHPSFGSNLYTFQVTGITTVPAVGDTYTNNTRTYTVVGVNVSGASGEKAGQIVASCGTGAPETSGDLTRATGSGDATIAFTSFGLNINLTKAKYVKQFNNYLFFLNVTVDGIAYPSRAYWTNIKDPFTILPTSFIEISKDDGQEITGAKVLSDRLVVFKTRSIYNMFFSGDADIPFYMPGGGKSNSPVGNIAPWSIQEVENGLTFLSFDGLYYYDGNNSYKLTWRVSKTLDLFSKQNFSKVVSCVQRNKNRVFWAFTKDGSTNDTVLMWDYFLNSFSVYKGMAPSAMATTYVSSYDERPYFADYDGYTYRMDYGLNDNPLGVETAISSYYWTNWRPFGDLISKKEVHEATLYYQKYDATLRFSYTYDFQDGEQFTINVPTSDTTSLWGTAIWGEFDWAGTGGAVKRLDLTGRGRLVRFKFENNNIDETFKIDGFGTFYKGATNV